MENYYALDIAKYIVNKCTLDEKPVTNLQLQKILYYIQKEFLKHNRQAFLDDIQAWKFGPVVPKVYFYFCGAGAMPINMFYDCIDFDREDQRIIDRIVEAKRELPPWDLVEETHKKDGAWDKVFKNGAGERDVITIELIKREG